MINQVLHTKKERHIKKAGKLELSCTKITIHTLSHGLSCCLQGTETRPDYLVNRDEQKNEGPFGEKNCTEIEK